MEALREDTLIELLGAVYDAPLRSGGWEALLGRLKPLLGAEIGGVNLHSRAGLKIDRDLSFNGWSPEAQREYDEHFGLLDPVTPRAARGPRGTAFTTADFVHPGEYRHTEFYNEWCRPHGLHQLLAVKLDVDDDYLGGMGFHRSDPGRPFGEDERSWLRLLGPHIERAVKAHVQLWEAEAGRRIVEDSLDRLSVGVVIVNSRLGIETTNRAARELAAGGDGFALGHDGVRAARPQDTRRLHRALAEAVRGAAGWGLGGGAVLALPRPSGRRSYTVSVVPLRPQTGERLTAGQPAAMLLIANPDRQPELRGEWLRRLWGLTPAEARLAERLIRGESLREAAEVLGIAVGTARNQLKIVFAKTETRRQAELVRLLLRSLPPLA